jgi:His-Xaa-Ser system radical SAM maturase HxsC
VAIQLRARGLPQGEARRILGRVTRTAVDVALRPDFIRVVPRDTSPEESLSGYAAVLFEGPATALGSGSDLHGYDDLDFLRDGYVAGVDTGSGQVRALYRPESPHNTLFATDRCNSNCLMCSQPPKDVDESQIVAQHLRLLDLIEGAPQHLGITGGEPTLLKEGLVQILSRLKERFPETSVLMLSNGRMYAYEDFVRALVAVDHPHFLTSIPLYADNAVHHDYVVQAKGAFDQTIQGFYNAARHGLAVEVRVVLHKQTIPGLLALVEFIYRNLPFVRHVALMGLENMGYVKKNWDLLWIDPVDYADTLEAAVRHLYHRRVHVSIYNLPLCVLPKSLWSFARQSISDFKNIYLDECKACSVKKHCAGLFQSSESRHSRAIKAIV